MGESLLKVERINNTAFLRDSFNRQHQKDFEAYFQEIVSKEENELEEIGKMYQEVYEKHITKQEEDEEYILGTMRRIKGSQ